jgi:hypothetical protein
MERPTVVFASPGGQCRRIFIVCQSLGPRSWENAAAQFGSRLDDEPRQLFVFNSSCSFLLFFWAARGECSLERLRFGVDIAMQDDLALFIEDAQKHLLGMQIDTAVEFVVLLIEPHRGPPGVA